jgi:hypothetical protein
MSVLKDLPASLFRSKKTAKAFFFSRQMAEDHLFDKKPLPPGIGISRCDYHPERRTIREAWFRFVTPCGRVATFQPDTWLVDDEGTVWTYSQATFDDAWEGGAA